MYIGRSLSVILLAGAALYAQQPPPASAPKPAVDVKLPQKPQPEEENQGVLKPEVFVRRFSAGIQLSVLPIPPVPNGQSGVSTSSPPVDALYTTTAVPHRIGWGGTGQIALTEHFAISASFLVRHFGYRQNTDVYTGVDNPNTIADERTHTVTNYNTQAKVYDIPITVRAYTKGRHDPGPRGFFELGGALRTVKKVSTSIDTTINDGTTSCCITNQPDPAKKSIRGLVAGAGIQITDPIGIRVVPEVRYTYWMGSTFNNLSAISRRHQVEAIVSLTF